MADIFLSYAREDREWAGRLAAELVRKGWSLFWDRQIPVGQTFDQFIEGQLDAAGCIVVLWSQHSVPSNWVKAEASEGARRGILHPVLIEDVKLPLEFRRLQTANLIEWRAGTSPGEYEDLVNGIAAIIRSSRKLDEHIEAARAALRSGDHARCLEILHEIGRVAEASGLADEVAELRRAAEADQTARHRREPRHHRPRADAHGGKPSGAGSHHPAEDGPPEAARQDEAQRRAQATQAHDAARAARHAAERLRAAQHAPESWQEAEAKLGEAETALGRDDTSEASRLLDAAVRAYTEAELASRDALDRHRQRAGDSRARMAAERDAAHAAVAPPRGGPAWSAAEAAAVAADAAYSGEQYEAATEGFAKAAQLFQAALHDEERRRRRDAAQPAGDPVMPTTAAAPSAEWPRVAERPAVSDQEFAEPAPAAVPRPSIPRAASSLSGARLAACVGGLVVVLGALGFFWHRSSSKEATTVTQAPAPVTAPGPSPDASREGKGAIATTVEKTVVGDESSGAASSGQKAPAPVGAPETRADATRGSDAGGPAAEKAATSGDGATVPAAEVHNTIARKQEDIGPLRTQADDARRMAAAAQAEKLAGPQWTRATNLYQAAQAAVAQGDNDKARKLLQDAIAGYNDSAAAASTEAAAAKSRKESGKTGPAREPAAAPATARADAEQARTRAAAARRAGEQVAAGFFANRRFALAQSKESDGIAALGRSDYAAAIRLLDEARSEYRQATQEAKLESEKERPPAPAEGQPGAGARSQ